MRSRNIKPGFFINEELTELAPLDRLLFAGLWCEADREGRLENRPKKLKNSLFPTDAYDVAAGLGNLAAAGFIKLYEVGGQKLIHICNFAKHQQPHGTEKDSTLPGEDGKITVHERSKNGCIIKGKERAVDRHGQVNEEEF